MDFVSLILSAHHFFALFCLYPNFQISKFTLYLFSLGQLISF
ncbi:hypothetical protein HMPREF0322_03656 [Desulfitobacterium hafniense DP7]|uniref:Uncharacterized protein n=1 Tax=Desulfitobacterium hafniense DP7 TaxID=537010 RepID=G9XRQ7_DESHA|nr:hypothetical protein HMPREF0322_03656 [Desulfitobacterium hafniense DP7]